MWLMIKFVYFHAVDGSRQRQGWEEKESRDGSAEEGEDHGSDVWNAKTLHQREQRAFSAESGGAGGLNICCCWEQVSV